MNSKERVLMALDHQEPDRIPLDFWWGDEIRDKLLHHLTLRNVNELQEYLGSDIRCVYPPYIGPELRKFEDGSYEDFWGILRKPHEFQGEGFQGEYSEPVDFPLRKAQSLKEIEAYPWPNADWFDYEALKGLCEFNREYAIVIGKMGRETQTIFIQLWFLRGLDRILMDFVERPDLVKAMIDKIMEFRTEHVGRILEIAGGHADILQIADDYGAQQGLMMSPAMWREFFAPHLRILSEMTHEAGLKTFLHCDGSSREIIPDLIDIGIDILNPIQPRCLGMDPDELKSEFGDRLCFHGAVDTQKTLPFGTKAEVVAEVRNRIDVLGAGGGYILAPVHTVEADVPVENLLAVYETAKTYGQYR
jgi:uroporphyrinogen decarboxylase